MITRVVFLLSAILLLSCQPVIANPASDPPQVSHRYIPSNEPILNPERGFFSPYQLPGPSDFGSLRYEGYTLVHFNIHLDNWRETDIPKNVLSGLDANFSDLRQTGLKAIVRFSYNQGPDPNPAPDASKAQILRHIEQLTPLLQKNADIIAWVEAGFIGAWGEWHNSTNGLDKLQEKQEILSALLKALPATRMVQLRYPYDIMSMFPTPADAAKARVAHHNDCFLSSNTDVGTYEHDGQVTIEPDQAYLAELTRFTPMSGETCALNPPRSDCGTALQEMTLLHFSAINKEYNQDVIRSWEEGGCIEEIDLRLGYRIRLISADFNERAHPGGEINLAVKLENTGFAAIMNQRPLYVVLRNQEKSSLYKVKLDVDPRRWEPGLSSFTAKMHVPPNASEGKYQLALWLPDEFQSIAENPHYAIQFANENTWEKNTGFNLLGTVTIAQEFTNPDHNDNGFQTMETFMSGTRN